LDPSQSLIDWALGRRGVTFTEDKANHLHIEPKWRMMELYFFTSLY
jgi:hypothetical protein